MVIPVQTIHQPESQVTLERPSGFFHAPYLYLYRGDVRRPSVLHRTLTLNRNEEPFEAQVADAVRPMVTMTYVAEPSRLTKPEIFAYASYCGIRNACSIRHVHSGSGCSPGIYGPSTVRLRMTRWTSRRESRDRCFEITANRGACRD